MSQNEIKTSPSNEAYRKGWSDIFLKDASEWLLFLYNGEIRILNPNGWDDTVTLETKITKQDFLKRLSYSDTAHITNKPVKVTIIP